MATRKLIDLNLLKIYDSRIKSYIENKINTSSGKGIEVYTNYSLLPTTDVEDKTITYCEENYTDESSNTYNKGFYEYKDGVGWEIIPTSDGSGNLIESISVNGTQQSIDANKNVDITVPTKTSDLINDSNFINDDNLNATYMKKSEYVSSVNNENVKCSDIALKIKGADTSNPQQYYGKDIDGNIGFHYLPITPTDVPTTEQRVINNAIADDSYIIDSNIDLSNVKLFTQCYKKIDGRQNVVTNIDVFDEYNKNKYIYNNENVVFDTSTYIKNKFVYNFIKVGDLYESEEIDKTSFIEEMVFSLK